MTRRKSVEIPDESLSDILDESPMPALPPTPEQQLAALIADDAWLDGRTPLRRHAVLQHLRAARLLLNGNT